jgi:hypothetical protein
MFVRKAIVALAAAAMMLGSTAAAAAPVAVNDVRAASPVGDAEALKGSFGWILALIILIGVIGVVAADSGEEPDSP